MHPETGKPAAPQPLRIAFILVLILTVEAIVLLLPGHLAIDAHEVDVLHAVNAAMRLLAGERQHIDFLTPLGPMAFQPVAWLIEAGTGIARAFLTVNVIVAAVLIMPVIRIATSRLTPRVGVTFGAVVIILSTALVYGGDQANVSVSMSYNRWAWAVSLVVLMLALMPPSVKHPLLDGAFIGLGLGYLALLKMTFFVAFGPVVALALILRGDLKGLVAAGLSGICVALTALAVFGGPAFVVGYSSDLMFVLSAEVRPRPGIAWHSLLAAPAYLPGVLCHLALVVVLRKTGASTEGLLLLALLPAFAFVTYQNWGNDPKWLIFLGFFALAMTKPAAVQTVFGYRAHSVLAGLAIASFALIAPVLTNMATSPLRNVTALSGDYLPMLADPAHASLLIKKERSIDPSGEVKLAGIPGFAPAPETASRRPFTLGGEDIPRCAMTRGYFGKMAEISARLVELGHSNQRILFADVTNPLSLVGPFKSVPTEAPWFYGDVPDKAAFDALVAPTCGTSTVTFGAYIKALNGLGQWKAITRDPHFVLFVPE